MRKILLCLEDYNESLFVETLLKKLGFSIDTVRNEFLLPDKLMAFSPDLVVATGDGLKVNGIRVSKKVKRKGLHAKLLLLFPRERLLSDKGMEGFVADGAIETPLNPRRVISSICQLTNLEVEPVMAKFEKLPIAKEVPSQHEEIQIIHSRTPEKKTSPERGGGSDSARAKKYLEFLKDVPESKQQVFSHKIVQSELDEIHKYEKDTDTTELENQRKDFVTKLFKKK